MLISGALWWLETKQQNSLSLFSKVYIHFMLYYLTQVILTCTKVGASTAQSQATGKKTLWYTLVETLQCHIKRYSFYWWLRDRFCNGHMEQTCERCSGLSYQCKVQIKLLLCSKCVDKWICHCIHDSLHTTTGK